jgi:hypothetical protein
MQSALQDLVARFAGVVSNPETRPLALHWSDVELLKGLLEERQQLAQRLESMRRGLDAAMQELVGPRSAPTARGDLHLRTHLDMSRITAGIVPGDVRSPERDPRDYVRRLSREELREIARRGDPL